MFVLLFTSRVCESFMNMVKLTIKQNDVDPAHLGHHHQLFCPHLELTVRKVNSFKDNFDIYYSIFNTLRLAEWVTL